MLNPIKIPMTARFNVLVVLACSLMGTAVYAQKTNPLLLDEEYTPGRNRPKTQAQQPSIQPAPTSTQRAMPAGRQLVLTTGAVSGVQCNSAGICSPASGNAPASSARLICPLIDEPDARYQLQIDYALAGPAEPGFLYTAVVNQPSKTADYLTTGGGWSRYAGGLYPPSSFLDTVGSRTYSTTAILPSPPFFLPPDATVPVRGRFQYTGWTVYVGYGVYTRSAQEIVANRRAGLNVVEAEWKKIGRWNNEYASDERTIAIAVQQNMVDNSTWSPIYTLPDVGDACFQNASSAQ